MILIPWIQYQFQKIASPRESEQGGRHLMLAGDPITVANKGSKREGKERMWAVIFIGIVLFHAV